MVDLSLGNLFNPSDMAIRSLADACPAHALPASLSRSPIALRRF